MPRGPGAGARTAGPGADTAAGELAGLQPSVVWQLLQSSVVATCPIGLPSPVVVLWQVVQVPTIPVWLNRAGRHAKVPWQALQSAWVGICATGLPVAVTPSWQLVQLAAMPRWSKRAGSHAIVVWQFAHWSLLAMCRGPLAMASVPLWQLTQLPVTPACGSGLRARPYTARRGVRTGDRTRRHAGRGSDTGRGSYAGRGSLGRYRVDRVRGVHRADGGRATAFALAATGRAWAPPPQLLVLWQPLQSLVSLLPEL